MSTKSVPQCKLGKNGPMVPVLGFGLMGMSYQAYGSIPGDEERFKLLDRAYEQGNTFWDSSEWVSPGYTVQIYACRAILICLI